METEGENNAENEASVVSPERSKGRKLHSNSKKGSKKLRYSLKPASAVIPRSFMHNDVEAKYVNLAGGISIVFFDQGEHEGFVNYLVRLFDSELTPTDKVVKEQLFRHTHLVACIGRRVSKLVNEFQFRDKEKKYKKCCFVLCNDSPWEVTSAIKSKVDAIVSFMNVSHFDKWKDQKSTRKPYVRQPDFNKTGLVLLPWDNYFVDEDVGRLARYLIKPPPAKDFGSCGSKFVKCLFSRPYSQYAIDNFGYDLCREGEQEESDESEDATGDAQDRDGAV